MGGVFLAKAKGLEGLDSACVDLVLLLYNVHLFIREVFFTFHHGESPLKSRFGGNYVVLI